MNLVKKVVDIDDEYEMYFDMQSIAEYQKNDESFIKGYNKLIKWNDEEVLKFIACAVRKKSDGNPIGFEAVKQNPLEFIIKFGFIAVMLVAESFNSDDTGSKKKLVKT